MRLKILISTAAAMGMVMAFGAATVHADDYPSRPIIIVIPYGPGGASDLSGRLLAGSAPSYLGQPILPINKTGAAGVRDQILSSMPRKTVTPCYPHALDRRWVCQQ